MSAAGDRFHVTGGAAALRPAAQRAAHVAVHAGLGPARWRDVELAVHEALANALEHGHLGRPDVAIHVEVDMEVDGEVDGEVEGRVVVRVTGQRVHGAVRQPRAVEERGRGRLLMHAGADHVEFASRPRVVQVALSWDAARVRDIRSEDRDRTR